MTPTPPVPEGFPDWPTFTRKFLLPSRTYLLSFRDQTLPARRSALIDAQDYFAGFEDEGHRSQLALLGLIGEAMQAVEDVGVLGHAFMVGMPGLSFYVAATSYDPKNVNNFFAQAHKRDNDYFLRFAALKLGGISATDFYSHHPPLETEDREAIAAAERGTARLLQNHICWLAKQWERYRQFFHAYKHGALLANPNDVQLMRDRTEVIARMAVWRRRRPTAEIGSNTNTPLSQLASTIVDIGELALDTTDYIVKTRSSVFESLRFTEDGSAEETEDAPRAPWTFWFHGGDVEEAHRQRLETRFGITFESCEAWAPPAAT